MSWKRRLFVFGSILMGLTLTSVSAPANRFADNPDRYVDRKLEQWFNPIGQVKTLADVKDSQGRAGKGVATAFLISPCYIVTDNHAVFSDDFPPYPRTEIERIALGEKYKMLFSVGVGARLPFYVATYATPVTWGDRDGANRGDWALLKLSSCLGEKPDIGWMELDVNLSSLGLVSQRVAIVGYPWDRGGAGTFDVGKQLRLSVGKATAYWTVNDMVQYSASTAPGESGSPILYRNPAGKLLVIGVHQGGHRDIGDLERVDFPRYSREQANQFINIRSIVEHWDVLKYVNDDFNRYGKSNPNLARLAVSKVPELSL